MPHFTCNLCGAQNTWTGQPLDREAPSCSHCASNVRTRSLMLALSRELFGTALTLDEFPRVKSLRGLGTSDSRQYADRLEACFDYRNTFYDRAPKFDVTSPPAAEREAYDFVISSEVLEHVAAPVETAFRNLAGILKPTGVLIVTVPYSLDPETVERYAGIQSHSVSELEGRAVVIARMRDGQTHVFHDPVFHVGVTGQSLEMREFSESALKRLLGEAGFTDVRIQTDPHPPFGVAPAETWSLPIVARKAPFHFSADAARELVEQWRSLQNLHHSTMRDLNRSLLFRLLRRVVRPGSRR